MAAAPVRWKGLLGAAVRLPALPAGSPPEAPPHPLAAIVFGSQHLAQRGDLHGEIALLDGDVGPGGLNELSLGERTAARFDQGLEQRNTTLSGLDRHPSRNSNYRCDRG